MGLYARVDLSSFEESANSIAEMIGDFIVDVFDSTIESIDSGTGPDEAGVQWDDMSPPDISFSDVGNDIAQAFAGAFMSNVNALCPVRTGYLLSSISCDPNGSEAECTAGAEYAQYVEYGTYKMNAQPYFEPAIEAGLEAAREAGRAKIDEMSSDFGDALVSAIDDGVAGISDFSIAGAIAMAIVEVILYALLQSLVNWFMDELFGALDSALADVEIMTT